MDMSVDFPSSARLHRPSEYAAALRARPVARGALFIVHRSRTQHPARLGLIIPKRHARLAVVRNAIKRVVREAWRHRRADMPPGDWVFRLIAKPPVGSLTHIKRSIRAEVDALLNRVAPC